MANCIICAEFDNCPWRAEPNAMCSRYKQRKMTNADRVRSMLDEELAEWIFDRVKCQNCHMLPCVKHGEDGKGNCKELWLAWLREEATDD